MRRTSCPRCRGQRKRPSHRRRVRRIQERAWVLVKIELAAAAAEVVLRALVVRPKTLGLGVVRVDDHAADRVYGAVLVGQHVQFRHELYPPLSVWSDTP